MTQVKSNIIESFIANFQNDISGKNGNYMCEHAQQFKIRLSHDFRFLENGELETISSRVIPWSTLDQNQSIEIINYCKKHAYFFWVNVTVNQEGKPETDLGVFKQTNIQSRTRILVCWYENTTFPCSTMLGLTGI